jgi:hypothetical protein
MTKPVAVFRLRVIGDSRQPFGAISLFQPVYHLMGDISHMASGGI